MKRGITLPEIGGVVGIMTGLYMVTPWRDDLTRLEWVVISICLFCVAVVIVDATEEAIDKIKRGIRHDTV